MPVPGCHGRPDGSQCPAVNRSDIQLEDEGGHSYCDTCLRALRAHRRHGSRTETPAGGNVNQDGSDDAPSSSDVIFNPLLAYASFAKYSGGSNDMVKSAILSRFSSAQIKVARDALWNVESLHDVIGPSQNRRATETRSLQEVTVCDILGALTKLDKVDRLPSIAILASDLDKIPRSHPEEALPISAADRMNRIEYRVTELTDLVERLVTDNVELRAEVSQLRATSASAQAQADPQRSKSPEGKEDEKKKKKKKKTGSTVATMPGGATLNGLPSAPNLLGQLSTKSSAGSDTEDGDDQDGFTPVVPRGRRKPAKPKFVTGSGGSGLNSFAAAEPNRDVFISGVAADTTEEDLKSWITDHLKADLKFFEKIQPSAKRPPGSTSQSFRATVLLTDFNQMILPESWPTGVRVRRFFPARTSVNKK